MDEKDRQFRGQRGRCQEEKKGDERALYDESSMNLIRVCAEGAHGGRALCASTKQELPYSGRVAEPPLFKQVG